MSQPSPWLSGGRSAKTNPSRSTISPAFSRTG
jgi:hypothetical protein